MRDLPEMCESYEKKGMFYFNDQEHPDIKGEYFFSDVDFFLESVPCIRSEEEFRSVLIEAGYPKAIPGGREFTTLVIKVGRPNDPIDEVRYGNIIGEAIVKYYNPEYEEILKHQEEPTNKASKDKTYYDRAFNQSSTNNSSLIFKKKS